MISSGETDAGGSSASERVVERVARREVVDPMEFETSLYEAIDAEALDAVFAAADRDGDAPRVEFAYCGLDLRVTPDAVTVVDGA